MFTLEECQNIINRHLNEINLPELPANLYEPVRYMLDLGAKRLRPSLVLMGCNVFTDSLDAAIHPAMAIEIFHNFTLVHDDIMDRSELRRNQPTVHVKWSPNVAILSGDAMVIKAYEMLSVTSSSLLRKILPLFNETALRVCEGQQYDMDYEGSLNISINDYLKMVEYKTAVLIAAALKIGGLSGGCQEAESDLLYEFGRNIGVAFQLQDDLLDVFADSSVFGKVTGNDIVSNKKTILLVEALELAEGNTRKKLLEWVGKEKFDREEKVSVIRSIYTSLNLEERVSQRIENLHQAATCYLDKLPVQPEKKTELLKFSKYLLNRQK
jgi:geranylgeranyl diphosphate synthase type II